MEPFVHLHVHSEYSLLDGANQIEKLVDAAVEDGQASLALTDHGNLYGAVEFYTACKKKGVKPILGCEAYLARESHKRKHHRLENPYSHLTLLARNAAGWRNLLELTTIAHLEGHHFRPRIDLGLLQEHAEGLICLSGCMSGPVNRLLAAEKTEEALKMAGTLQDLFGQDAFYLEVMRNGMQEQEHLTEGMVRLRNRVQAPLIATNDIHYLRHEDCRAQDAMICLQTGAKRDDPDRWRMSTDTLFFRSREEMNQVFGDLPEALRNTLEVAEKVDLTLEMGKFRLPRFDPPDGRSPEDLFLELCEKGFARFFPGNPSRARERLNYEIGIIREMGFISYFLIVWDLIRYAREKGIPVGPGRGSAAGSIVAYVLEITRIDPLKYDLFFERFLNPARASMPDIDIDFCKDGREEMLRYVRRRYGEDRVCQIITFGKMKARAALRDIARVLDLPLSEADKVAKKVPPGPNVTLAKALEKDPELAEVPGRSELHREWFDLALKVEGLARHSSKHAAGVVIADCPLRELVPLSRQDEAIITQWDMKSCEQVGLLKMDFLGLRTLSILNHARIMVQERSGDEIDLDALPLDDPAVYELICSGDTEGIFQLESPGMRRLLTEVQPSCYEDLIAVLALFRPGPLGAGDNKVYARRKHGQEKVVYDHPLLEGALKETYGVLIYQEQIMRVVQILGGFSLSEADLLRKVMSKKKPELIDPALHKKFMAGSMAQGVAPATAKMIWEKIFQFADYGFNKSHSTGYAMVTYQTAWMKIHHRPEFYAATFTYEAADTDKLRTLIEDARHHGIQVLPPCVNHSSPSFSVSSDKAVRYGLSAVKGIGSGAAETLCELRKQQEGGGFPCLEELLTVGGTANLNKTTFESLVKAGACDVFHEARVDMLDRLAIALRAANARAEDRRRGQGLLFEAPAAAPRASSDPANALDEESVHHSPRPLSEGERKLTLALEKEALGLFLTHHPLDPYRDVLEGISPYHSRNLSEAPNGSLVHLAGIATQVQIRPTRRDPARKFARFRVEDLYGSTAAIVFPAAVEKFRDLIVEDFIGNFSGRVDQAEKEPVLLVEGIEPLGNPDQIQLKGSLEIVLPEKAPPLGALKETLERFRGSSTVRFLYQGLNGRTVVHRAGPEWRVDLGTGLFRELEKILGPGKARITGIRETPSYGTQSPRFRRARATP